MDSFQVLQIDHVELFVPDRQEAADWYCRVLGLHVVAGLDQWTGKPGGPLMIATAAGGTKLALFEGQPQQARSTAGFHRVAFRVDAAGFLAFVRGLDHRPLNDQQGRAVTADAIVDHDLAYSTSRIRSTSAIRTGIGWRSPPTSTMRCAKAFVRIPS
jgi:catechol 2,3-dioxygenase-like lactoylglutathione lyase family enzyme